MPSWTSTTCNSRTSHYPFAEVDEERFPIVGNLGIGENFRGLGFQIGKKVPPGNEVPVEDVDDLPRWSSLSLGNIH